MPKHRSKQAALPQPATRKAPVPLPDYTTSEKCRQILLNWLGREQCRPAVLQNRELFERVAKVLHREPGETDEGAYVALVKEIEGKMPSGIKGVPDRGLKGVPGRRGYPIEALNYALELRRKNPMMVASKLRGECLKRCPKDELPPDGDNFRRWLNRSHKWANRAN